MPALRTMFIPLSHVGKAELICSSIRGRFVAMFDHHWRIAVVNLRRVFDSCSLVMGIAYLVFFAACGYSEGSLVFLNGAYAFGSIAFASLFLFIGGKCHD